MEQEKISVLLVEDNADFAEFVKLLLGAYQEAVFDVAWQPNGIVALQWLEQNAFPDVILMDYFMPGLNGIAVTKKIRERHITTPIVFLTGNTDAKVAAESMKMGADEYILKSELDSPMLPCLLINTVKQFHLQLEAMRLEFEGMVKEKQLQAVRELVVTICHELNNPLAIMHMAAHRLGKLSGGQSYGVLRQDNSTRYLSAIQEGVNRIHSTVKRLEELNQYQTTQYVDGITMVDLSAVEQHA
jgi:CheY-like chemotaxis protein